jgi:hypothetical protein
MNAIDRTTIGTRGAPAAATGAAMPLGWPPVGLLIAVGLGLWVVSALGLDPGNVLSQRLDLHAFHLPSARRFAEAPFLEALADYPAAPFPLFYMLVGAVLALGGGVLVVQALGVALGLVLLWLVWLQARANRGFPPAAAAALAAAVLISPYFRGTTVYANTDALALALVVAAYVFADRPARRGAAWPGTALAFACLAVWVRQFYLFAPLALFLRDGFGAGTARFLRLAAIAAAFGLPVAALVLWWGGLTPPQFQQLHAATVGPTTTVPVILSVVGLYALPSAFATARFHRDELLVAQRRPAFLACAGVLALAGLAVAVTGVELEAIEGGGMATLALRRLTVPDAALAALLGAATFGIGCYLAYLVLQTPRANLVLVLVALAFVPTGVIYQRYFDPLLPVVFGCLLRTRESESLARSGWILLYPALEMVLTVVGQVHYSNILAARLAAG